MAETNNRILVVDDEVAIVEAYCDFLLPAKPAAVRQSSRSAAAAPAKVGGDVIQYEILKAHSGDEAVEIFKKEFQAGRRIAAGFFDVKMGAGLDGVQAIQEIWKLDPDMNCTVVTAYQDRSIDDMDQLFGARFKDQWDYLNKPFTRAEIIQKARQMIAAWNRKAQLAATQAQLVRSERLAAVGQVARAIGHEFGNVLMTIMGQADLAMEEPDGSKVKVKLDSIIRATERASLIVKNLQSFSKTSAARVPVDLSAMARDTLTLVGHEMKKRSITLTDRISSCGPVQANAGELEQVLLNLIINALHAMPQGGALEVGCENREPNETVLWVKDTGTGIPPEILPKIFEYAFTTKGDHGSGLGLSISKEIVEQHRGVIQVSSEVGKGTQFLIRFPRGNP